MSKYEVRKQANEASRNRADHDREPWSEQELETLLTLWDTDPDDLQALADMLGRTVEACRQRYYTARNGKAAAPVEEKLRQVNTWTGGFTSLEEMGY